MNNSRKVFFILLLIGEIIWEIYKVFPVFLKVFQLSLKDLKLASSRNI
tara:strand:- start:159 stop:302 length:144 start_codon:yes stop_codon:yes gene_type:complete